MFAWLKKHFVPHYGNKYRPHFLHQHNTIALMLCVLAFEVFAYLIPVFVQVGTEGMRHTAEVLPAVLATLTNEERQEEEVPSLVVNPLLSQAAQLKAEDMAAKGYFAHTSPEGKSPWYWIDAVGYEYNYAGENLAVNFTDSQDVTDAWMDSPTHKANIIKRVYREMGTGVAVGMYKGRKTTFVAQVYATPPPDMVVHETSKETRALAQAERAENAELPTEVLGASTDEGLDAPATPEPISPTGFHVPLSGESMIAGSTTWQKLSTSPREVTNTVLLFIIGIVLAALLLHLLKRRDVYHHDLTANGLAAVALIGALIVINSYLSTGTMETQSLDYDRDHVVVMSSATH